VILYSESVPSLYSESSSTYELYSFAGCSMMDNQAMDLLLWDWESGTPSVTSSFGT
jgi:hypothetical protein